MLNPSFEPITKESHGHVVPHNDSQQGPLWSTVNERHITAACRLKRGCLRMLSASKGAPPSGCPLEELCSTITCLGMLLGRCGSISAHKL